jgi:single-stranded DNA-binding protein
MSLNKVTLIGHLGQDPELRNLPSGQAVGRFSVATDEPYTDKEGKRQEHTESLWNDRLRFAAIVDYAAGRTKNRSAELHTKEPADEKQTTIRGAGCTLGAHRRGCRG